ncbi:hypothetical protein GCM10007963_10300 [Lutibacter litoralis]|nr:hypothetical protein GCM10007963_10300 [Lutibacter litoralis]
MQEQMIQFVPVALETCRNQSTSLTLELIFLGNLSNSFNRFSTKIHLINKLEEIEITNTILGFISIYTKDYKFHL